MSTSDDLPTSDDARNANADSLPDRRRVVVPGGTVRSWSWNDAVPAASTVTPMLFLHGGPGGSCASFDVFAEHVHDRRLVLFDQLGSASATLDDRHRADPRPLWTIERFGFEVDAVRDAHGLDDVVLFGHSWGGWLALDYLCRGADGVRAAVLADTAVSFEAFRASIARRVAELPAAQRAAVEAAPTSPGAVSAGAAYDAAAVEFYTRFVVRGDHDRAQEVYRRQRATGVFQVMQGADELHGDGALADWDRSADARTLTQPVLVVVGEHDHMDPQCARALAAAIPGAELVVLPDVAHCPHLERPEQLVSTVMEWVDSVA